jgi:hypothetical protein
MVAFHNFAAVAKELTTWSTLPLSIFDISVFKNLVLSVWEMWSATSMIALVNYAKEPGSAELRELPVPELGEEDVQLKVEAAVIYSSDLHQYAGEQSWKVNYPVVLGHEFTGEAAKPGARVKVAYSFMEEAQISGAVANIAEPIFPRRFCLNPCVKSYVTGSDSHELGT